MAFLTTWNMTDLPSEIIDILEKDIEKFDDWQNTRLYSPELNGSKKTAKSHSLSGNDCTANPLDPFDLFPRVMVIVSPG